MRALWRPPAFLHLAAVRDAAAGCRARVPVGLEMRDAWMRSMKAALETTEMPGPVRDFLTQRFGEVADFLRNVEG